MKRYISVYGDEIRISKDMPSEGYLVINGNTLEIIRGSMKIKDKSVTKDRVLLLVKGIYFYELAIYSDRYNLDQVTSEIIGKMAIIYPDKAVEYLTHN